MTDSSMEKPPKFTLGVDPQNMAARIFRYRSLSQSEGLSQVLPIAIDLARNDPSLQSTYMRLNQQNESLDLVIEATDSGDWMSSSGAELKTQRQEYVLRVLGGRALA